MKNKALLDWIDEREKLEYTLFKYWWEHRRTDNPRTAITASLARKIAILIYDDEPVGKKFSRLLKQTKVEL